MHHDNMKGKEEKLINEKERKRQEKKEERWISKVMSSHIARDILKQRTRSLVAHTSQNLYRLFSFQSLRFVDFEALELNSREDLGFVRSFGYV